MLALSFTLMSHGIPKCSMTQGLKVGKVSESRGKFTICLSAIHIILYFSKKNDILKWFN